MKERKAKVLEIFLRAICVVFLLFSIIIKNLKPMIICFICYFVYKTVKEIFFYYKRKRARRMERTADTILLSERVICYIVLIIVLLFYWV